jgi:hypothetical protein
VVKATLGYILRVLVYKVFIVSVLSYVMQLESEPLDLMDMYDHKLSESCYLVRETGFPGRMRSTSKPATAFHSAYLIRGGSHSHANFE